MYMAEINPPIAAQMSKSRRWPSMVLYVVAIVVFVFKGR